MNLSFILIGFSVTVLSLHRPAECAELQVTPDTVDLAPETFQQGVYSQFSFTCTNMGQTPIELSVWKKSCQCVELKIPNRIAAQQSVKISGRIPHKVVGLADSSIILKESPGDQEHPIRIRQMLLGYDFFPKQLTASADHKESDTVTVLCSSLKAKEGPRSYRLVWAKSETACALKSSSVSQVAADLCARYDVVAIYTDRIEPTQADSTTCSVYVNEDGKSTQIGQLEVRKPSRGLVTCHPNKLTFFLRSSAPKKENSLLVTHDPQLSVRIRPSEFFDARMISHKLVQQQAQEQYVIALKDAQPVPSRHDLVIECRTGADLKGVESLECLVFRE